MILDVLVFALGFMVAALLMLAALPAVWRRALRLSEERLSRLVPLSSEEIAAERDHLRAAHAVAVRRVEQKLEGSEADRAALRIAAARREARIAALDDAAIQAEARLADSDTVAASLRAEVAGLWAGHGAAAMALDGLARLAERRLDEVAVLQGERNDLLHRLDRDRGSMAGLETRLIGAEARVDDLARELAQARGAAIPTDQTHEIEALKSELAFMAEQARSAERRATESARAHDALKAKTLEPDMPTTTRMPPDDARLRAAVAALADEVMRSAPLS